MKYVMFKKVRKELTVFIPVIFPELLVHKDVADALLSGPLADHEVHSAGVISPMSMEACGGSTTLGLQSDPHDTHRIVTCDYGGCFE